MCYPVNQILQETEVVMKSMKAHCVVLVPLQWDRSRDVGISAKLSDTSDICLHTLGYQQAFPLFKFFLTTYKL
jgi:hypothetical protein